MSTCEWFILWVFAFVVLVLLIGTLGGFIDWRP